MARANVRVRAAEHGDETDLALLVRATDIASTAPSSRTLTEATVAQLAERFETVRTDPERVVLVACDESGALVGMLAAGRDELNAVDTTPVLHVTHLLVVPAWRRRGVGRALLSAMVHVAEEQGIEHLVASAAAGSREGNRYLARLGFAPVVVRRVASTATLRRSLGLTDVRDRVAVLRRARRTRAERVGLVGRAATRGA
jgi:GNAT superfamily N-acetyltransferase